jgi:hypothetical protein
VQFVFELRLPWATTDILGQLEGNYRDLSVQKYSSNVVEKCLKYAGEERRTRIIRELINNAHLDQVMQDPFGNYVIQAALQQSKVCILIFNQHFFPIKSCAWQFSPGRKICNYYMLLDCSFLCLSGVPFGDCSLIF